MKLTWVQGLFWLSAVYDVGLGAVFLFAGGTLFERFGVLLPNHPGYIQFPAILLIVFGVMFARIAMDPVRLRECMLYGAGLKAAYAGTVLYHHATAGIPGMWLPFAYMDLVFLVAFLAAWRATKPGP